MNSNVERPTPLPKWVAAVSDTPIGKVPARAVLVRVIGHGGAAPEFHIQTETDDLERSDTIRHERDISDMLQPAAE